VWVETQKGHGGFNLESQALIKEGVQKMKKVKFLVLAALFLTPFLLTHAAFGDINSELMKAAEAGDSAKVEQLLKKGADVNAKNKYGDNALKIAASKANNRIMVILIEAGAREYE
jgi:ankyrin repeat protein